MTESPTKKRVALVIDYQNVHNTAHDVFNPEGELHDSLIDPLKFAQEIERLKNLNPDTPSATVTHIEVFRGLPHDSLPGHRYNTAQKDKWLQSVQPRSLIAANGSPSPALMSPKKLPTMKVTLRPLRYKRRYDETLQMSVPDIDSGGEEKGVDVLIALAVVRLAQQNDIDTVILASQDTDLIPALEEVVTRKLGHVETVRWFDKEDSYTFGRLGKVWVTYMERDSFLNSRDTRDYS